MRDPLTPESESTRDPKQVVEALYPAWNDRDVKALSRSWGPEAEFSSPFGQIHGRERILEFVQGFWEAFPDARLELIRSTGEGSLVAAEGRMTGTHNGVLRTAEAEVPPTGRRVQLRWMGMFEVDGDEVVSEHLYLDQMELLGQLGLAPSAS